MFQRLYYCCSVHGIKLLDRKENLIIAETISQKIFSEYTKLALVNVE